MERIEALGEDAVAIGTQGRDLHFTSIKLARDAEVAHGFVRKNAAQGETRSHGFFYKAAGTRSGMVGLPVMQSGEGASASVLYLQNRGLRLTELGALESRRARVQGDGCKASCVDWYGNARPLFLKGRVFALMGYELVEGEVEDGRVHEVRRISYAPTGTQGRR